MLQFAANLSMLFNEYEFKNRFAAAANAGFKGVEYLFPYNFDKDILAGLLSENDLKQVLFNLPAGNWDKGDRGIACNPYRTNEFREGVDLAIEYAQVLGNKQINCLAGIPQEDIDYSTAHQTLVDNLKYACTKLKDANINLLIEAINTIDIPDFFLNTTAEALEIRSQVNIDNLYLQYDIYHMQIMEGDITRTLQNHIEQIGHIQLADNPGRHEPGTGEINYPFLFKQLEALDYSGWIGCEYKPLATTEAGLGWMETMS